MQRKRLNEPSTRTVRTTSTIARQAILSLASPILRCLGVAALFRPDASAQQPITPTPFTPFGDGQYSVLIAPLTYRIGESSFTITVPAGFVTDFASTPRAIWAILPPTGRYQLAAVVHEFLYWDQGCTRRQADDLLRAAMAESQVGSKSRDIIYYAVRSGGEGAWTENSLAKAAGKPRIIPPERMNIPPLATWPEYQTKLVAWGVKPSPKPTTPPGYCEAAKQVNLNYRFLTWRARPAPDLSDCARITGNPGSVV
jgi:hypothetical protein